MTDPCLRCGADPPVEASFCPTCGQPAEVAAEPVEPPPRPLSGRNAAIIFGGMALAFVVALVVVLAGPGETKVPPDTSTTTAGSQPTPPSSSPPNDPGPAGARSARGSSSRSGRSSCRS
jgi:hypothetical protein